MTFNYQAYFEQITPHTQMEIYNRFIFAFASVHTTWENNVRGYNMLKNKYHKTTKRTYNAIVKSKLGLHTTRTKGIVSFTTDYLENPQSFLKHDNETWIEYSDRLERRIFGLGFAKTRFAIELIYPNTAELICTDTHIIQWAKQKPDKVNRTLLKKIEQGFLAHSRQQKLHPIESRWKWWDKKQGYDNPKYWSYCLE